MPCGHGEAKRPPVARAGVSEQASTTQRTAARHGVDRQDHQARRTAAQLSSQLLPCFARVLAPHLLALLVAAHNPSIKPKAHPSPKLCHTERGTPRHAHPHEKVCAQLTLTFFLPAGGGMAVARRSRSVMCVCDTCTYHQITKASPLAQNSEGSFPPIRWEGTQVRGTAGPRPFLAAIHSLAGARGPRTAPAHARASDGLVFDRLLYVDRVQTFTARVGVSPPTRLLRHIV